MTNKMYQKNIDIIADHYMSRVEHFCDLNDIETCNALYSEFIVDGQDPEDGEYQWQFIEDLTNSNWPTLTNTNHGKSFPGKTV